MPRKHVALDVHIALESFITNAGNIMRMSDSLDLYNGLPNTIGAVKFGIYVTQVLIGDGFMVRDAVEQTSTSTDHLFRFTVLTSYGIVGNGLRCFPWFYSLPKPVCSFSFTG